MRVGRYELGRQLGAGGNGTVYEALLEGPGGFSRRVAVKHVRGTAGLQREARLGGLLRHPHLVDVYEVGEEDGGWFLAMELCADGSLHGRGPLPPRAVVEVGLHVCAALHYAHEELGLVHLDLKPQNLLLDGPVVKVADLGTAQTPERGRSARVHGTPAYMAPEHWRGEAVDARADVYALGIVLRELASGVAPAAETTVSVSDPDPLCDPVAAPVQIGWLEPVLARAVVPDASERFATMAEMAAALRALDAQGAGLAEALGLQMPPLPPRLGTNVGGDEPLVGRGSELAVLAQVLGRPGLNTLVGPPGIGKTALAREAARRLHAETGAEAWFCDLSEATGREDLVAAVARALGVPLGVGEPSANALQLGHALAARPRLLLVLDSFEQVVAHTAIVAAWLARAAGLGVLVTSRQALGVPGEQVIAVDVLSPADGAELVRRHARARGVELGGDPLVDELVRRLDALPLALVLASDRLGVLSLAEVAERLSLSLLRSGRIGHSEREATLRGAIAWSVAFLQPSVRATLACLSVFRGGFTLEGAARVLNVANPGSSAADAVGMLVERSLVAVREGRLRLLEPVREYAQTLLGDEQAAAEAAHGAWLAEFGTSASIDAVCVHGGPARLRAMAAEIENLHAASRRAIARGDGATATATLRAVWCVLMRTGPMSTLSELADAVAKLALSSSDRREVLYVQGAVLGFRGHYGRSREVLEQAMALPDLPAARRAALLTVVGDMYRMEARLAPARDAMELGLALAVATGDRRMEGVIHANLGILCAAESRFEDSAAAYERGLVAAREVGDLATEGTILGNLGNLLLYRGQRVQAREALEQAVAIHRRNDNRRLIGIAQTNLGNVYFGVDPEAARAHYDASIAACREVGIRQSEAIALANLGRVWRALGDPARSRASFEQAAAIFADVGDRLMEAYMMAPLAVAAARAGDLQGAEVLLDRGDAMLRPLGWTPGLAWSHAARAEVRWCAARPDEARSELAKAAELMGDRLDTAEEVERVRRVIEG